MRSTLLLLCAVIISGCASTAFDRASLAHGPSFVIPADSLHVVWDRGVEWLTDHSKLTIGIMNSDLVQTLPVGKDQPAVQFTIRKTVEDSGRIRITVSSNFTRPGESEPSLLHRDNRASTLAYVMHTGITNDTYTP